MLVSNNGSDGLLTFGCMNNECTNGTVFNSYESTLTILCCYYDFCNALILDAASEMNDSTVEMTEKVSSTQNSIELEAIWFDKSTQQVLLVNANTGNLTSLAAMNTVGIWIITQMVGLYMLTIC